MIPTKISRGHWIHTSLTQFVNYSFNSIWKFVDSQRTLEHIFPKCGVSTLSSIQTINGYIKLSVVTLGQIYINSFKFQWKEPDILLLNLGVLLNGCEAWSESHKDFLRQFSLLINSQSLITFIYLQTSASLSKKSEELLLIELNLRCKTFTIQH